MSGMAATRDDFAIDLDRQAAPGQFEQGQQTGDIGIVRDLTRGAVEFDVHAFSGREGVTGPARILTESPVRQGKTRVG